MDCPLFQESVMQPVGSHGACIVSLSSKTSLSFNKLSTQIVYIRRNVTCVSFRPCSLLISPLFYISIMSICSVGGVLRRRPCCNLCNVGNGQPVQRRRFPEALAAPNRSVLSENPESRQSRVSPSETAAPERDTEDCSLWSLGAIAMSGVVMAYSPPSYRRRSNVVVVHCPRTCLYAWV